MEDLRFALRQLRRSPGFAFFIIATLGIGIGANTTIFGAVNAFLLRPLPFADSERLVALNGEYLNRGDGWSVSLPNALDWGRRSQSLEAAGYFRTGNVTVGGERPERLDVVLTSASLLPMLGAQPAVGRFYSAEEDSPKGDRVVVLSHALWQQRFAGERSVIGRTITLNGNPHNIIGVAPASLGFPSPLVRAYLPVRADETTWNRASGGLQPIARLKPGVTLAAAQRDFDALSATLAQEFPGTNKELKAKLRTLREKLYGSDSPVVLYTLLGAVGFVLLIACVNVANLLLARATGREREVAVRTALGASRIRVMRQLLVESLVLAVLGGAAGCLVSLWGTRLLLGAISADTTMPRNIGIDGNVLLFTGAISLFTGLLFGLVPALQASRLDLSAIIGTRAGQQTRRRTRMRNALVVSQVAFAAMLLIGAGLMIKSLVTLLQTDPGFRAENLLTMRVNLDATYDTREKSMAFQQQALERLRTLPGVISAGAADWLPLSGTNNFNDFHIEGQASDKRENAGSVMVTPGYLQTMNIRLVSGRDFDARDVRSAPGAVLVNRAFAEKYFQNQDALGKRIVLGFDRDYPREIVGVVGNVLHGGLAEEQRTEIYVPYGQLNWNYTQMSFALRTRGDPRELERAALNAIAAIDRNQVPDDVQTMETMLQKSSSVETARILAGALGIFGSIALLLAALGLYGVISYGVAQRRYEIGVRGALGATRANVLTLIMGQGMTLVGAGLVLGLMGAFATTRYMGSQLHGVGAFNALTFLQGALLLAAVAALAMGLPARRATRIDPAIALRSE